MTAHTTDDEARRRGRRERFRAWRRDRPFAGGVLLMLAGLLIGYVPLQFAFELLLVGGSYTFIGLFWAVGVFLTGAFVLYRPEFSTIFGVLGVVLSILSLLGALGGLLLGMIVGIIGGNLCVAWSPPAGSADRRETTQGGDGTPARTDGGEPTDAKTDRPEIRTDGGRPVGDEGETAVRDDGGVAADAMAVAAESLAGVRSALADVVSAREAELAETVAADLRERARDAREIASQPPRETLRQLRRSAVGLADAAKPGESSGRLAVTLALVVVAGGTLSVVGTLPAAALFGDDDQTTYTVDADEIRLDEGGQICAASAGSDTYRVTITDATLVDATVYKQQGGDAVKADFPTLTVDDTIVMYTESDDEDFEALATTVGCTDEDQTSRTVFRNRYQESSKLLGPEGVTMLNMEVADSGVPEAGGFQFVAPDENGSSSTNVTGGVQPIADDIDDVLNESLVDRLENGTDGGIDVDETVGNATDGPAGADDVENATGNATDATNETVSSVGETVENTTEDTLENTTGDVVEDPPMNVTETVNDTTETVNDTTETVDDTTETVNDTTDEVTDTTDDTVDETTGETTSTAVDDTTDTVDDTTETVTDAVDETTDEVVRTVEETVTSEPTETEETTSTSTEETTTTTEVLTTTPTPVAHDEPEWLDQVDDDERTSVVETVEETDGGFDDVENVTEETENYDEETIDGDENLTRLDNGTVLLLNGTDADSIDWSLEDTLDTDLTSTDTSETEAKDESGDGTTSTETDDGGTLFG